MNTAEMCFLNVIIIYFHGLGIVHSLSHCHSEGNRELEPNGAIVSAIRNTCSLPADQNICCENCLSVVPVMLW